MIVAPGDLVHVRYLDLPDKPQTHYFVIAVYETDVGMEFFYYRPGETKFSHVTVAVLDEPGLEVSITRL